MDTTRAIYKLAFHKHPLFPSAMFVVTTCHGCHVKGPIHGGYFCNDSQCNGWSYWFHKECAEAPLEINHPSHSEHPLLLTNDSRLRDCPCDYCGQKLLPHCYTCPTCEYKVDLVCGIKPSPPAIEHPVSHTHPLVFLKKREYHAKEGPCELCKESIGGPSYSCLECHVYFHVDCALLSNEVNHPCHPLKLISSESLTNDDAKKRCHFCSVQPEKVLYHCSSCNFTMCLACTKHPPPHVIEHTKIHTHPLRLLSSGFSYTCKVCGYHGYGSIAYICLQCNFIVHGVCIGLPRVININRHDHRISFTHHLGHGGVKCGVCRNLVSRYYGAYSCSLCSNYAVHTRCATNLTVWDGIELEWIPEISKDVTPFKVVGDNLICHFSHENHTLRLHKDNVIHDDCTRCEACIHPVGFDPIYSCEKCRFILHKKCANLPMEKKLVFEPKPYTLERVSTTIFCRLCGLLSCGFNYKARGLSTSSLYIDVHCGSLSEPFIHDGHLHPLYFDNVKDQYCGACKRDVHDYLLSCGACNFYLCFYCATLPEKIWHKSDEHPLTLYRGGKASDRNWCDVCERELDPSKWFFTCSSDSDCEVTLHAQCALGDFSRLMPGKIMDGGRKSYTVVLNNGNTRPLCSKCHSRCKFSVILKDNGQDNGYICSNSCLPFFFLFWGQSLPRWCT